jgi:thiamine biosynthesis protein ThiS
MSAVEITLNGEPKRIENAATVAALLEQLGLDPRTVAVEHNRRIVRRAHHAETPLGNGDIVELVHFVGGG